ncbi:MAG: amino acid permease [Verrucomicrobia bacterium]|nr:amino acid permease [Verrucomicrobiota bacterium]
MPQLRQLSLLTATALVVASMIGVGVFTTSGYQLDHLSREELLAAWFVGGLLALLGALSYGGLARRIPESGGEYIFLARTLHPAAGYIAGWISLLVGFSAPLAAASLGFGEYLKDWLPFSTPRLTGSVLILLFAALHATHVGRGAWVQNCAVLAKLLLIAGLVGVAATRLEPGAPAASTEGFPIAAFAVALVWISFSYSGWNAAIYIGGEIRDPERNVPRAMIWGAAVVMALYLALNTVFIYAAPVEVLAGKPEVGRIAAQAIGGAAFADFTTALIAIALATSVSSLLMAGPRVYARMAEDGYLPGFLRFPQQGPPRAAILFQTFLGLAILWSAELSQLLTYIGFTLGLSSAAAVVGLIRVRLKEGSVVHVPGWPWVPALFIIFVLAVSGFSIAGNPGPSLAGLATLGIGFVAWRIAYGRRQKAE